MKKNSLSLFFFLIHVVLMSQSSWQKRSDEILNSLKKKDFEKLKSYFDTTGLAKLVSYQQISAIQQETKSLGTIKKVLNYWEEENGCKTKTASLIQFKKEKKILYILLNAHQQVQSIELSDPIEQPFFQLKGYKGYPEVTDLYVNFRTKDGLSISGNLSFSDTSKHQLPVAILVHGSGPNDRDETIGPNKPFRDLAQGLSQKGLACFRYDKRTYAYQFNLKPRMDSLTLYDETINDVADAIQAVKQFSFIDTNRIYIIGHSQGAMCAPVIAELNPEIKAIVMMAGPSSSLLDIIPQQVEYLANLDDSISSVEQMQINSVNWMVNKIKNQKVDSKGPALLGGSALYWQSIKDYDQVKTAMSLSLPVFIINGERDYQVPMKEFNLWKEKLEGKANFSFKSYDKLNHLFMEGEGKPNPDEYNTPAHIPQYVVDDIIDFVLKN